MDQEIIKFIIKAKQETFTKTGLRVKAEQPESHQRNYQDGELKYTDTFSGKNHFIGNEVVYKNNEPIWGMNYYGQTHYPKVIDEIIPYIERVLNEIPENAPYRGPEEYNEDEFRYRCEWIGNPHTFRGKELIFYKDELVFELRFVGGELE